MHKHSNGFQQLNEIFWSSGNRISESFLRNRMKKNKTQKPNSIQYEPLNSSVSCRICFAKLNNLLLNYIYSPADANLNDDDCIQSSSTNSTLVLVYFYAWNIYLFDMNFLSKVSYKKMSIFRISSLLSGNCNSPIPCDALHLLVSVLSNIFQ